jgi:hypothetical protein
MTKFTSSICTIILFSCILFSCASNDEKFTPEKFEIARTVVRLPFDVKEIVAFEGGYFDHQKPVVLDTIVQKVSRYGYVRDLQNIPNLFVIKSSHFNGVIVRDKNEIRLIKFEHTS